ncbi:hypothetical protein H8E07_12620 [bacterium]|nr:hypothetical protein [bacterium]
MLKLISILTLIIICGIAGAQPIDPDPDGMSFYFDTEGHDWLVIVDPWEPAYGAGPTIATYLLLTRPSTPFWAVKGWEARFEYETNTFTPPLGLTLTPGAIDLDDDPDDYVVECDDTALIPITGDVVVLASVEFSWLGFEGYAEANIHLYGVEGSASFPVSPGYISGLGLLTPCHCIFGSWGSVAFVMNELIRNEGMTWGDVKSLY